MSAAKREVSATKLDFAAGGLISFQQRNFTCPSDAMAPIDSNASVPASTFFCASVGPELALFDIDVDHAALTKRGAMTLPVNIQYAWPHPLRSILYVVSSNGGPGAAGDRHYAHALAIDAATGSLRLHGEPALLPSRPIHASVDGGGAYLLTAYN